MTELPLTIPRAVRERYYALASDLYDAAFAMLDAESELTGEDAGIVAEAARSAFLAALVKREA